MSIQKILIFPSAKKRCPDCIRDLLLPAIQETNPCNRPQSIIEQIEAIAIPQPTVPSFIRCKENKNSIFTWTTSWKSGNVHHYIGWAKGIGTPRIEIWEIDTTKSYRFTNYSDGSESLAAWSIQKPRQLSPNLPIYTVDEQN